MINMIRYAFGNMIRAPSHKRTCMPRYVNDIYAIPAICQRYECNMTTIPKDRVDLMCTQHTLLIYVADMPRYGSDKIGYRRDISETEAMGKRYGRNMTQYNRNDDADTASVSPRLAGQNCCGHVLLLIWAVVPVISGLGQKPRSSWSYPVCCLLPRDRAA